MKALAILSVLALWCGVAFGQTAPAAKPILTGPLAKLDVKPAKVESARGKPRGTLNIGMHFGLDPGWLDPLGYYGPALHFYYLVHDALIKPMPQGEFTYSLAEHAEMAADFTRAAFRLRPGLKFQDGRPLTTADVKWNYENYRGYNFKLFHDKLDRLELVDDRTIVFHFKEPFVDFLDLYNGANSGIGWIVPRHYYERVGKDAFDMAERVLGDLRAVGLRSKVQMLDAPAYMAQTSKGRKGFPGNRTIVQRIDPRPGGAKALIRLYAVCGGPASYVCDPKIDALWTRHEASVDPAERERLSKEIQRMLIEDYDVVPLYLQPFVHAVGPKVLPDGEAVHHYWDTLNAPFPWPWEVWEVK